MSTKVDFVSPQMRSIDAASPYQLSVSALLQAQMSQGWQLEACFFLSFLFQVYLMIRF